MLETIKKFISLYNNNEFDSAFCSLSSLLNNDFHKALNLIVKGNKKLGFKGGIYRGKKSAIFWKSNVPIQFFNQFFTSQYFDKFLSATLNESNYSFELLSKIAKEYPQYFINKIKYQKIFLNKKRFEQIKKNLDINSIDTELFFKECEYLQNLNDSMQDILRKNDILLKKISFDNLMIHFSFYIEKFIYELNPCYHAEVIEFLIAVINKVLNRKKKLNPKVLIAKYNSPGESRKFLEYILNIINSKKKNTGKYDEIENLFNDYGLAVRFDDLLDSYCYDNFQIDFSRNIPVLTPSDYKSFQNWKKNGLKLEYLFKYYEVQASELDTLVENSYYKNNFYNNQCVHSFNWEYCMFAKEYFFEKVLKTKWGFDPKHYVLCHNMIKANKSMRYIDSIKELKNRDKEISYAELIMRNMMKYNLNGAPVEHIGTENVVKRIKKTFKNMSEDEITRIINFSTSDVNSNNKIDLRRRPFLKVGNSLYYIVRLFCNTLYSVVLLNESVQDNYKNNKDQSEGQEKIIGEMLKKHNFKVKVNFILNNSKGEIDVLAFKDDTLFVIEAKYTFIRRTLRQYVQHSNILNKAGNQLDHALEYIKNNYSNIQKIFNIECNYNSLKIYPLIVSTSFEDDYKLINDKYRKISLFEFRMIMQNTKWKIRYEDYVLQKVPEDLRKNLENSYGYMYEYSPEFIDCIKKISEDESLFQKTLKENNLYDEEYDPSQLIEIIEKGKLWDFLDEKDLSLKEFGIQIKDKKIKYLY